MAEWRQVAKVCALGDGHISTKEVDILRKVILADGTDQKTESCSYQVCNNQIA